MEHRPRPRPRRSRRSRRPRHPRRCYVAGREYGAASTRRSTRHGKVRHATCMCSTGVRRGGVCSTRPRYTSDSLPPPHWRRAAGGGRRARTYVHYIGNLYIYKCIVLTRHNISTPSVFQRYYRYSRSTIAIFVLGSNIASIVLTLITVSTERNHKTSRQLVVSYIDEDASIALHSTLLMFTSRSNTIILRVSLRNPQPATHGLQPATCVTIEEQCQSMHYLQHFKLNFIFSISDEQNIIMKNDR